MLSVNGVYVQCLLYIVILHAILLARDMSISHEQPRVSDSSTQPCATHASGSRE
jgi:hypothetical protein